jgi:hypothetical protein
MLEEVRSLLALRVQKYRRGAAAGCIYMYMYVCVCVCVCVYIYIQMYKY